MRRLAQASLIAAILAGSATIADTPQPFPDFSAKRVSVPKPGARPQIVQIDPAEQARLMEQLPKPTQPLPTTKAVLEDQKIGAFSWFWTRISIQE